MAVYQRALQNDPQMREAEANRLAALESKPQALAALLPQLNGSALASKERDIGPTNERITSPSQGGAPVLESYPFDGQRPLTLTSMASTSNRTYSAGRTGWRCSAPTRRSPRPKPTIKRRSRT